MFWKASRCWSPIAAKRFSRPGDCAGFKVGEQNGHHRQSRTDRDVLLLEIGTRTQGDGAWHSGIDLVHPPGGVPAMYTRLDAPLH